LKSCALQSRSKKPRSKRKEESEYNPIDISNLITGRYESTILMCTYRKAKSVNEISRVFDIPIAVCYRKVKKLEDLGFLRCTDRILSEKGKWVKLFRSQVVYAHFYLEKGKFRARVQLSSGAVDNFGNQWLAAGEMK
jgi:hypothetical protein